MRDSKEQFEALEGVDGSSEVEIQRNQLSAQIKQIELQLEEAKSRAAIFRIYYLKELLGIPLLLCVGYFFTVWNYNFDNPAYRKPLAYFPLALLVTFGLAMADSKNNLLSTLTYYLLFITILASVFVLQYWVPDKHFWTVIWMIGVPFIIFYFLNIKMITKEYIKEMPLYRRWFILRRRGSPQSGVVSID